MMQGQTKIKLEIYFLQSVQHNDNTGFMDSQFQMIYSREILCRLFLHAGFITFFAISRRWRGFTGYASVM